MKFQVDLMIETVMANVARVPLTGRLHVLGTDFTMAVRIVATKFTTVQPGILKFGFILMRSDVSIMIAGIVETLVTARTFIPSFASVFFPATFVQ